MLAYDDLYCVTVGLIFGMGAHQISHFPDNTYTQTVEWQDLLAAFLEEITCFLGEVS